MPAPSPVLTSEPQGAAVVEVLQHLDRLLDDPVRLVSLDVDHEALAARIVLVARVVQALLRGRTQPYRCDTTLARVTCRGGGRFVLL
jgi:hypothetical protein